MAEEKNGKAKVIVGTLVFALFWMVILVPFISKTDEWQSLPPPLQYLSYNLGFFMLFSLAFGSIISILKKALNSGNIIKNGIASWFIASFVFDIFAPSYYLDMFGNVIASMEKSAMANSTPDAMFAWIFGAILPGIKGTFWLYAAVYVLVPIFFMAVSIHYLTEGEIWAVLGITKPKQKGI